MSAWSNVKMGPPDSILGLVEAFNKDAAPGKVASRAATARASGPGLPAPFVVSDGSKRGAAGPSARASVCERRAYTFAGRRCAPYHPHPPSDPHCANHWRGPVDPSARGRPWASAGGLDASSWMSRCT
jgi:hypothetical protein